jgi:hypothetical protein
LREGARAREPEPDPEDDRDFQTLREKVSKIRGPQPAARSFSVWLTLDEATRKLALEAWDRCLAEWTKGGQKHAYGLETYLRDRLWTQAPAKKPNGGPMVLLELRSAEWFAVFWKAFLAGDRKRCESMVRFGKMRTGFAWPAKNLPSRDEIAAFPKIPKDGEAWRAWRGKLFNAAIRFDDDLAPAWVWVPSEIPDPQSAFASRPVAELTDDEFLELEKREGRS